MMRAFYKSDAPRGALNADSGLGTYSCKKYSDLERAQSPKNSTTSASTLASTLTRRSKQASPASNGSFYVKGVGFHGDKLVIEHGVGGGDDRVIRSLRNREAGSPDVLAQLQRQSTPDYVEQSALLANTITPQTDADGVLFPHAQASAERSSQRGKESGNGAGNGTRWR
jgi:hypothetical protein